jgi:hypothetical protein
MTRLPTDTALGHLIDGLRSLEQRPKAGQPRRIDDLEARLLAAVRRDRSGSVVPDGYPTTTGGAGAPNGSDSSTERAALTLVDRPPRDRHHELTALAVTSIEDAILGLNRAVAALNSIDDLTKTTGPPEHTCGHCTDKRGQGNNRPAAHRGTVGDRLERALDLCEACWGFVRQSANPNTRQGQLPTDTQIRDHEDRGRWRIHVA